MLKCSLSLKIVIGLSIIFVIILVPNLLKISIKFYQTVPEFTTFLIWGYLTPSALIMLELPIIDKIINNFL